MCVPQRNVFLDTSVIEGQRFAFRTGKLAALAELVRTGRVACVLTDVTVREVEAHLRGSANEAIEQLHKWQREMPFLRSPALPNLAPLFEPIAAATTVATVLEDFRSFVRDTKTLVVPCKEVACGPILDAYFTSSAPFAQGKDKKYEFPDAIALSALRAWCEETPGMVDPIV